MRYKVYVGVRNNREILFLIGLLLTTAGCNLFSESPSKVLKEALMTANSGNYEKLKEYTDADLLTGEYSRLSDFNERYRRAWDRLTFNRSIKDIEIIKSEARGKDANVEFTLLLLNGAKIQGKLIVVKEASGYKIVIVRPFMQTPYNPIDGLDGLKVVSGTIDNSMIPTAQTTSIEPYLPLFRKVFIDFIKSAEMLNSDNNYNKWDATPQCKYMMEMYKSLFEPNDEALVDVGRCFAKAHSDDKALELFRAAIAINPSNYLAHWELGAKLIGSGNMVEGKEELNKAILSVSTIPDQTKAKEVMNEIASQMDQIKTK